MPPCPPDAAASFKHRAIAFIRSLVGEAARGGGALPSSSDSRRHEKGSLLFQLFQLFPFFSCAGL